MVGVVVFVGCAGALGSTGAGTVAIGAVCGAAAGGVSQIVGNAVNDRDIGHNVLVSAVTGGALGAMGGAYKPTPTTPTTYTGIGRTTATEAVNVIPSSGKTHVVTPRGTVYDVPEGWTHRVADNGKGSVYQKPGSTGNKDMVRIMEPTPKYPDGYARVYNGQAPNGQPVDVFGKPGPQSATHIPETYVGPWPGWPS